MKRNTISQAVAAIVAGSAVSAPALGGVTVYEDDHGKYIKMGGRIQLQYNMTDPDGGDSSDEVIFRRLRPYIEGSVTPDWKGKFQFDLGKASDGNEVSVKDAYAQYSGLDNTKITIGNANFQFSRELLTSSKRQQLVERTFVGDHNYGTPDRQAGLHITGASADSRLTWGLSGASAAIDPDDDKLDFDTLVNRNSDFNEGWIVGGRVDFHPLGLVKMAQGNFDKQTGFTIGAGAFTFSNDDDNNSVQPGKADVDSVTGLEISGAARAGGLSLDAQYNLFDAETVAPGITSGLYVGGETELRNFAVEGGYMFGDKFELVTGWEQQDADGYADKWTRASFGANYFMDRHNTKIQATYRMEENVDGTPDNDQNVVFIQFQYVI